MTTKPRTSDDYSPRAQTRRDPAWPAKMWTIVREDILSQRVNDTIDGATVRYEKALDTVKSRYPDTINTVKKNVTPILSSLNERKEAVTQAYRRRSKSKTV